MKTLLAIVLLLATSALAQEQPTIKQCRADREAWGPLTGEDMDKLSYKELQRRESELDDCRFVDKERLPDYVSFSAVFVRAQKARMFKYLDRHGYWQKFLEEDEHGER